ncbi:hypothetical protein GBAR_LOCUS20736 [Geodia barretti]|uniref:Uncharacterized protein n=1 Tax=Geodia barretti TaxID=519541 RepID=A0AA35WY11_GEOBA|nr:hypothetical protein GBAR_LOCUS20736 [Geodia barretti]
MVQSPGKKRARFPPQRPCHDPREWGGACCHGVWDNGGGGGGVCDSGKGEGGGEGEGRGEREIWVLTKWTTVQYSISKTTPAQSFLFLRSLWETVSLWL